jgi:hypothetical protein
MQNGFGALSLQRLPAGSRTRNVSSLKKKNNQSSNVPDPAGL